MTKNYRTMKNLLPLILFLFLSQMNFAQNVNIPDANLKYKLLTHDPIIDINDDDEIQVSEALAFNGDLDLSNTGFTTQISDPTGLEAFVNITGLFLEVQLITSIDVSVYPFLEQLNLSNNNVSSIDVSQNPNLTLLNLEENNLSEISLNHADLFYLFLGGNNLTSIDLTSVPSLGNLNLANNNITELDLSQLPELKILYLSEMPLVELDVTNNLNLQHLDVRQTNISELDVSNNIDLQTLTTVHTNIEQLDVSHNYNLTSLSFWGNDDLTFVNLKNANAANLLLGEGFYETPNIEVVCLNNVDDLESWHLLQLQQIGAAVTSYCSFTPAQSNIIEGGLSYNTGDGCDAATALPMPNTLVKTINGANSFGGITNENGEFLIYADEGINTTFIQSELPAYFTTSPGSHISNFTGYGNTDIADFCLDSNQTIDDLNVMIFAHQNARPGFSIDYTVVYENLGTTTLSGEVTFEFDETMQSFTDAVPSENASTTNTLTFQFENLEPLQNREIHIEMLNFPPPTVNLGDELVFNVDISPDTDDYTPENNSVSYFQEVINSYDPNDKTVLEGSEIAIENADEYLHYLIRFQNTGTASAVNVVVTDTLNEKLNWDSMRMVSASHDYRVQITNDNFVEFIFEGIELPHEDADEEGSNGYIVYKIKPKDDVVVGDIIDGDAAIYFDFNQPIITNVASTEIVETTMSTDFFNLENSIKIYPNPSNRMVNISAGNGIEIQRIEIYSITGQKLLQQQSENDIDISNFPEGMYFMKIYSVEGNEIVKKLIKK